MTAIATAPALYTTADLLALPENEGLERWLIRGRLRERTMTKRNRRHGTIMAVLTQLLGIWRDSLSDPKGAVACGEVGCILRRSPESTVGIDVAYFGPEVAQHENTGTTLFDGPPILAVEILSPSDRQDDLREKIEEYLACGVKLVWIVDPNFHTITVHRPDAEPVLFNRTQTISAEPHLPGFVQPVARVFE